MMQRFLWSGIIVIVFGVGLAAGLIQRSGGASAPEIVSDIETHVSALQRQLVALQQQLAAKEDEIAELRQRVHMAAVVSTGSAKGAIQAPASQTPVQTQSAKVDNATQQAQPAAESPQTPSEDTAMAHFQHYLDETAGMTRQERLRRARALLDKLRAVGEPAVRALLGVLEEGLDTRERSAAARLLGALQDPQALPALQEMLETESDLMLRRAAARGLARLETPEAVPVLETVLSNGEEDRFVRMSAAYGLAQLGETQGISGLEQLFTESAEDGRGHSIAFRVLMSMNSAQSLPLMREVVRSEAEVMYRVGAIQFLAGQGDQEAVPLLQQMVASPNEQPSVREAAESALLAISSE